MEFHDYHLKGYTVGDFGETITLNLVFDYPNLPTDKSTIEFSDVAAYHFIHTGRAIITDITETPWSKISKQATDGLVEWARKYGGLVNFDGDLETCKFKLEREGYKLWTIESAIGFEGLVIAKDAK